MLLLLSSFDCFDYVTISIFRLFAILSRRQIFFLRFLSPLMPPLCHATPPIFDYFCAYFSPLRFATL